MYYYHKGFNLQACRCDKMSCIKNPKTSVATAPEPAN